MKFQGLSQICPFRFPLFAKADLDLSHGEGCLDCSTKKEQKQGRGCSFSHSEVFSYLLRFPQLHQQVLKEQENRFYPHLCY